MYDAEVKSPFGVPGDLLWVREAWLEFEPYHRPPRFAYRADITDSEQEQIRKEYGYKWKPSIHMPRWASRLTLRVRRVWVERVQDISEQDATGEGLKARDAFEALWDSIYAGRGLGWTSNPLVWACEFEIVKGGADQ